MAKLTLILLAAPVALTSLSMPAAAQERTTVIVRYDDLNMASVSGRERLQMRVRMAARDICGTPQIRELRARQAARQCEAAVLKDTDVQLAGLLNSNGMALADRSAIVVAAP